MGEEYKPATCQYCLADCNKTAITSDKSRQCPVCGSDYTGERRSKEFRVLLEAGLGAEDD